MLLDNTIKNLFIVYSNKIYKDRVKKICILSKRRHQRTTDKRGEINYS